MNIYIVLSFKVNEIILNIKYLLFVVVQTWNKRPADKMKGDPLTLKRKCLWIQLLSYKVLVIHLEKNELLTQHKGLKITIFKFVFICNT